MENAWCHALKEERSMPLWLRGVLNLFSYCYRGVAKVHQYIQSLNQYKSSCPVICVGNISVGGTGKTPFVILLARALYNGQSLAVLTRGYRSNDEPNILRKALQDIATIYVGKNRKQLAQKAKDARLIILDDGMQNRHLHKDQQIVMLPSKTLWGKGHVLPRGFLREKPDALKKSDLIVLHHSEDEEQFRIDTQKIRQYSSAPIIGTRYTVKRWNGVDTIKGKRVVACCGIGSPESFFALLEREGAIIEKKYTVADHAPLCIDQWEKEHSGSLFCCTEKDAVKLPFDKRLCWPECQTEVVYGVKIWETFCCEMIKRGGS